ncbi:putative major facilitator superfamily transporter [Gordonia araii NBRC 100433]|uniref:Putative major facilitator superfamily transporter n=1 Tax=Gordonia araii NBRC 100433 TaxID=1073574 RepID=G7GY73_9ACTN|nr:MFS transporter [Gordonia araii]NNG98156.1 MFS transporter [Gordonia araii NBRC 100433]GAB08548.1 putative major facilitator superfamily transporter [Gordonia araii NBRC 100433]
MPVGGALFVSAWGGNQFTPLLVMYKQEGLSNVIVDALLFVYVFGIVPALMIGGPASDRWGRRPLMLPAPILAGLGSVALAMGADSVVLLSIGRLLSGAALGLAMAVGGSWLVELTRGAGAPAGVGARRATMCLTAGFGVGAAVAGVLAQWGPWPTVFPYVITVVLAAASAVSLWKVPETRFAGDSAARGIAAAMRIPSALSKRFLLVVAPVAPWVFGACAIAYAIVPDLLRGHTSMPIAFAAACCVIGLTSGFAIQSVGRRIDRPGTVRGMVVALAVLAAGMLAAIAAEATRSIPVALVAAAVLGCGYGMAMIGGLLEVQRIAGPDDLGGLTAVFYALTYIGFASPALLAWLDGRYPGLDYRDFFLVGLLMTGVCLVSVLLGGLSAGRGRRRGSGDG